MNSNSTSVKLESSLATLNHLKEKAFIECVNDLIEKDILVFYEQTPYIDGNLLTDPSIAVKSGLLLTTSNRISSLQYRYDLILSKLTKAESDLKVLEQLLEQAIQKLPTKPARYEFRELVHQALKQINEKE